MPNITGHCLCNAVRFTISAALGPAAYCHCTDCRRVTGSAFNISVPVAAAGFEIAAGQPKAYTMTADSGTELTRHFCGDCGAPVYTSSPKHPDTVYVKAGLLDDPSLVEPGHQSWVHSAVPWSEIDARLPSYDKASGQYED